MTKTTAKISLLVTRPAALTLPALHEWSVINGRNVKGKQTFKSVVLKPGPNRDAVDPDYWGKVRPKCAGLIRAGVLVEITNTESVPEKFDPGAQIKYQSVQDAQIAIAECEDLELLQAWHHADKREEVQKAVEDRLREMVNKTAPADAGEE